MKNQLKEIKEKVLQLQHNVIDDFYLTFDDEESDSLLEDYTRKYDKFIQDELDYYYTLL